MEGGILALPPPHKIRKDMNGKRVISITPAMLQDLLEQQRKRKIVDENLGSNLENRSPTGLQQNKKILNSNKISKIDGNRKNLRKAQNQIVKIRPFANQQQPLSKPPQSNVSNSPAQPNSNKLVPIKVVIVDPSDLPSVVEDFDQNPTKFSESDLISKSLLTSDEFFHQIPSVANFETVISEGSTLHLPLPTKSNADVENFLDTLPKANMQQVEDEISKIKTMIPFLQQILFSTFNVAGKLLDKNHLMDTGRKRIDSDQISTGTFTKRMLGLTSVLNCLETHLMTNIESLQQTILTHEFLPEAKSQPNFIESLSQMDIGTASCNYKEFLSEVESQILFTSKLQELIEDAAH